MCEPNAGPGTCIPITLTVTETVYTGTTSSSAGTTEINANAPPNTLYSIGSATLAAGTNVGNSSSIALDTTVRVTATSTNTLFTTRTLSSGNASASVSKTTSTSHISSSNRQVSKTTFAGSIIGGLAGLVVLVIFLLFCCQYRSKIAAKLRLKRKGSDASELNEKAKELKVRETALAKAERRKSSAPQFIGPTYGGGFVSGGGLGSPTGSGGSRSGAGAGSGTRRRSGDARGQVGKWI